MENTNEPHKLGYIPKIRETRETINGKFWKSARKAVLWATLAAVLPVTTLIYTHNRMDDTERSLIYNLNPYSNTEEAKEYLILESEIYKKMQYKSERLEKTLLDSNHPFQDDIVKKLNTELADLVGREKIIKHKNDNIDRYLAWNETTKSNLSKSLDIAEYYGENILMGEGLALSTYLLYLAHIRAKQLKHL